MNISVVLCAYNPRLDYLQKVLWSLKDQSLPVSEWELIVVDNNSSNGFDKSIDLSWHPNAVILREEQQGLIFSRIRGSLAAQTDLIVSLDDDTPLDREYLSNAFNLFNTYPKIGIAGGKCEPIYEITPPQWIGLLPSSISGRDFGNELIIEEDKGRNEYPKYGPILIIYRKDIFLKYCKNFNPELNGQLGRKGGSLASGEDNDIVLYFYQSGHAVAYHPGLKFKHFIPLKRLTFSYARKLIFESNRSWVKMLHIHKINPWKPIPKNTYVLRCALSWIRTKAWKSRTNFLNWTASCGTFKGLSEIA